MITPDLLARILRRKGSMFQEDLEAHRTQLTESLTGASVLVIGAAGSIGSAFTRELVRWPLGALRLADPSENNLVELVRDLRASALAPPDNFATSAIALGSTEFDHFLAAHPPFDYVVNFAALKHVRAERDPFTLMRMLQVNVLALDALLARLAQGPITRFFSVSSDKAVNPANLMGASKALMEQTLWQWSDAVPAVTARFANVAFSDGSLLHGFLRRLEKRQPLAAPLDVKRYFISHAEAGQLCLLASLTGDNREIFIPRLKAEQDLSTFAEIAVLFLQEAGYTPRLFADDQEARQFAAAMPPGCREWPCHFTVSDTTGEKDAEEFLGPGEQADFSRYRHLGVIRHPTRTPERLNAFLTTLNQLRAQPLWELATISQAMEQAVPELSHRVAGRNLDGKM
ncbi:MAG: polysaccharide biosynthesis protein [Magnetococcales bacterium]|nr:polysaccharide biosynthesis protein [Magnetococcales bacterium]